MHDQIGIMALFRPADCRAFWHRDPQESWTAAYTYMGDMWISRAIDRDRFTSLPLA